MAVDDGRLIADAERRTQRAWQEDGLPEIGGGVLGLFLGGLWLGVSDAGWPPLLTVAAVFAGGLLMNKGIVAKARLTDRRIGFVRPRVPSRRQTWQWALWVGLGAAFLSLVNTFAGDAIPGWGFLRERWMLLVMLAAILLAASTQPSRWYALLAAIPLAVIALGEAGYVGQQSALGWCLLGLGAASLALGLWRLRRFLAPDRAPG